MKAIEDPSEVAAEFCRELMARDETIAGVVIVIAAKAPDEGVGPPIMGASMLAPGDVCEGFAHSAALQVVNMIENPEEIFDTTRPRSQ